MHPQEIEERDYQMGAQSELQNALQQSQIERATREPDEDQIKRRKLLEEGRFVVAEQRIVYCSRTDASLGVELGHVADFATHDEAMQYLEDHYEDFPDGAEIQCPEGKEPKPYRGTTGENPDVPF